MLQLDNCFDQATTVRSVCDGVTRCEGSFGSHWSLGAAVVAAALGAGLYAAVSFGDLPPPPLRAEDVQPPRDGPPRELQERVEREVRESIRRDAALIKSGEDRLRTAGTTITIAGKQVKLPQDAYIEAVYDHLNACSPKPCPKTPVYEIRRGSSILAVSIDGTIDEEFVKPGEEHLFNFVREALR